MRRFRARITEKDTEIDEINQKIRNVENSKRKMLGEKDDLQNQIDDLNSQVANIPGIERKHARELETLKEQVSMLTAAKDQSDANGREVEKRAFGYKQALEEAESNNETLRNQLRSMQITLDDLTNNSADKDELQQQLSKNRNLQEQLVELREQADEDNDLIYKLEREKDAMQGEIMKERNARNALVTELEEIGEIHNDKLNKMRKDLQEKTEEADSSLRRLNIEQRKVIAINGDLEEEKMKLEGVEKHLETQSAQMEQLRRRIGEGDAETLNLREYKLKYEDTKKRLEDVERRLGSDLDTIRDEMDKLRRKNTNLTSEVDAKQEEIDDAISSFNTARTAKNTAENNLNNLQIRCDDMEMELAKMKSDKDAILAALNEKTREFESKCDELEESENDKGRIKSQLSALSAEMDEQISNARRQTQRRLDQVTNEKKTLEETLAITTQSFNKSSKEVDKLRALPSLWGLTHFYLRS